MMTCIIHSQARVSVRQRSGTQKMDTAIGRMRLTLWQADLAFDQRRRGRTLLADARPWVLPQATSRQLYEKICFAKGFARVGGWQAITHAIVDPNSVSGIYLTIA